jgi:hypothetical protein
MILFRNDDSFSPHISKTKLTNSFAIWRCEFIVLRTMENSRIPDHQFHFTITDLPTACYARVLCLQIRTV